MMNKYIYKCKRISTILIAIVYSATAIIFSSFFFWGSRLQAAEILRDVTDPGDGEDEESGIGDGKIELSLLVSGGEQNNAGDIVTVSVIADTLEHITRFGPVELNYNNEHLEFLAFSQPVELEAFTYEVNTEESGLISVSAVDNIVEQDISEGLRQEGAFEDNSFYTESPLPLFRVSFRVLPDASGQSNFHINSAEGFRNSNQDTEDIIISQDISISVAPEISNDASLSYLRLGGITLEPDFAPDVYEYYASANRQVTAVSVNATPNNLWSAVTIDGNDNLQLGDNLITVNVIAQNGITSRQYRIHLTRQETYVAEGSGFLDNQGDQYTFVNFPNEVQLPDGFTQTTKTINGYSVPVFAREGISSVLVYLYDGENAPGFYIYSSEFNSVIPYVPGTHQMESSRIISVCEKPDDIEIPYGFRENVLFVNNTEIKGYANSDGIFICYMEDEQGSGSFFEYNVNQNTFEKYVPVDRSRENMYRIFFRIFLIFAAVEAVVILITVVLIHKVIDKRKKPRPKRV